MMDDPKLDKPLRKTSKGKSFVTSLLAGVMGAALTLTVAPQMDLFQAKESTTPTNTEAAEQQSNSNFHIENMSNTSTNSIADMVEARSEAIVGIVNISERNSPFSRAPEQAQQGTGSGVIYEVTEDGAYIVTNHHVIEGATEIEVSLLDGKVVQAELVGTDALTDIAVLKMEGNFHIDPIPFGDSDTLRAGEQVIAIGNPLGLDLSRTVTQGIVSAIDRTITVTTSSGEWDVEVIQTDAAINPGNSGGALLNTSGQLIGINSMKIAEDGVEGLGFAIPSNKAKSIITELMENGEVERPYLGVRLANLNEIHPYYLEDIAPHLEEGVMIVSVEEKSAAAQAGLNPKDIIVAINGKKIANGKELRKYLYDELTIGEKATFGIYRNGQLKEVEVVLQ